MSSRANLFGTDLRRDVPVIRDAWPAISRGNPAVSCADRGNTNQPIAQSAPENMEK